MEENEALDQQQAIYLMHQGKMPFHRTVTYQNGETELLEFPPGEPIEVSREACELLKPDIQKKALQRCPPPTSLVDGQWEFQ